MSETKLKNPDPLVYMFEGYAMDDSFYLHAIIQSHEPSTKLIPILLSSLLDHKRWGSRCWGVVWSRPQAFLFPTRTHTTFSQMIGTTHDSNVTVFRVKAVISNMSADLEQTTSHRRKGDPSADHHLWPGLSSDIDSTWSTSSTNSSVEPDRRFIYVNLCPVLVSTTLAFLYPRLFSAIPLVLRRCRRFTYELVHFCSWFWCHAHHVSISLSEPLRPFSRREMIFVACGWWEP